MNHDVPPKQEKKRSPLALLAKYFLSGLFILLPLVITSAVLIWLVRFFVKQLGPATWIGGYLELLGLQLTGDSPLAYIAGWLVVLGFIFMIGFLVEIGARNSIKRGIDLLVQRIPLINRLYKISGQIVSMISQQEPEDFQGMSVVYCFFGDARGAAFIALMPTRQVFRLREVDYHIVLIPSAPVPVGGSMMLVPVDSIVPAQMSVEDFMQVYVSMGSSSEDIIPLKAGPEFSKTAVQDSKAGKAE